VANALQQVNPPAPDINAVRGGQPSPAAPNPLGAPGGAPPQAQQPPAPTHQQTVAALRHFDAIQQELVGLLKDPDVGKSDVKSKIIDGMTGLVARRIVTPAGAVVQLGTVPDKPFDQKQWLLTHLQTVIQSSNNVLDHHRMAFAGQDVDTTPPNPDNHISDVAGLMSQFKGKTQ
jgi:hypothetical protein